MARITVEDCLTHENNRFALVQLASKRTKQLLSGARMLINESKGNKAVVTALREIAQGAVRFMTPEDEAIVREREERLRELGVEAAPSPVSAAEDLFILPTNGAKDSNGSHSFDDAEELDESEDLIASDELEDEDDSEEGDDSDDADDADDAKAPSDDSSEE